MLTERNRLVFEAAARIAAGGSGPVAAVEAARVIAGQVFGPEEATSKTEVAPSASEPIRRGDLVTVGIPGQPRSAGWRVTGFTGGRVILVHERSGEKLTAHESVLTAVPLVCPGHKVDLATRKCVHCGLTDKAIVAAGQTWSAAEGTAEPVRMSTGTTVGAAATSEVKKLSGWANDVYQVLLRARADGRIPGIRVLIDNNDGGPPFQLVVSVRDFLAAFGLVEEYRE